MYHCLIIHVPQDKKLHEMADKLKNLLSDKEFKVKILPAADTAISDIAPADLLILGSPPNASSSIHKDYSELLRAFSGANLSGKMAGFIASKGSKTVDDFKKALNDSGITFFTESLPMEEAMDEGSKILKNWLKNIKTTFKEFINAHAF